MIGLLAMAAMLAANTARQGLVIFMPPPEPVIIVSSAGTVVVYEVTASTSEPYSPQDYEIRSDSSGITIMGEARQ